MSKLATRSRDNRRRMRRGRGKALLRLERVKGMVYPSAEFVIKLGSIVGGQMDSPTHIRASSGAAAFCLPGKLVTQMSEVGTRHWKIGSETHLLPGETPLTPRADAQYGGVL